MGAKTDDRWPQCLQGLSGEEDIRRKLAGFLEAHDDRSEVQGGVCAEHPVPGGQKRCDIYLRGRRAVIECKAPGGVGPDKKVGDYTQLVQLSRYVMALRQDAAYNVDEGDDEPWVGILTDGRKFFAYKWDTPGDAPYAIKRGALASGEWRTDDDVQAAVEALTQQGKPWIPDDPASVFRRHAADLRKLYEDAHTLQVRNTQQALWLSQIRSSGVDVAEGDQSGLFLEHCFLVSLARLLSMLLDGKPQLDGLAMEDGFISWIGRAAGGLKWMKSLWRTMSRYEWRGQRVDVLRRLYMGMVDRRHRKMYGEYYTPDWLAELVVEKTLDEDWMRSALAAAQDANGTPHCVGVLDPTCGSGTLLFHAASRLCRFARQHYLRGGASHDDVAQLVVRLINGIDIHPVAVEMAQANVRRALPAKVRCVHLNIVQGDAMLLKRRGDLLSEQGGLITFTIPESDGHPKTSFSLPEALAEHSDHAKRIKAIADSALGDAERQTGRQGVPKWVLDGLRPEDAETLRAGHRALTDIIMTRGNGVWAWYMRNQLLPIALRGRKIDRIVSNPPWLRWSDIQVQERKDDVQTAAKAHKLWPETENHTGFDLATLCVQMTEKHFLSKGGRGAYIVPMAALTGGQWLPFRELDRELLRENVRDRSLVDNSLTLAKKHPDGETLNQMPFLTSGDCCVLGFEKGQRRLVLRKGAPRVELGDTWDDARDKTKVIESLKKPAPKPSFYAEPVANGATIFPSVLTRLDPCHHKRTVQSTYAKKPWRDMPVIPMDDIPSAWILRYVSAKNLLPFHIVKPLSKAVAPMRRGKLLPAAEANAASACWKAADETYRRHKRLKSPKTLMDRLDYGQGLSRQLSNQEWAVIYNASGQNLRAAVGRNVIVDNDLYRVTVNHETEAHYLAGTMNAPCLRAAFMMGRAVGWHFHKTPLNKTPIPRFDPNSKNLAEIAALSKELAEGAVEWDESTQEGMDALVRNIPELQAHVDA